MRVNDTFRKYKSLHSLDCKLVLFSIACPLFLNWGPKRHCLGRERRQDVVELFFLYKLAQGKRHVANSCGWSEIMCRSEQSYLFRHGLATGKGKLFR